MSDTRMTPPQRAAAIERVNQSIALRSGAGCGKTFVLARRFAELVHNDSSEDPLRHFVALTFTEKAALEMLTRVRATLKDFADKAQGEQKTRILGWLASGPEARISTIHGFCSSLLRAHAIEAGLDPSFSVCANELVQSQMIDEAVQEAILSAVENEEQDVAYLLTGLSFNQLHKHVVKMIKNRNTCPPAEYIDADANLKRWEQARKEAVQKVWDECVQDRWLNAALEELKEIDCSSQNDTLGKKRDQLINYVMEAIRGADPPDAQVIDNIMGIDTRGGSKNNWPCDVSDVRSLMKTVRNSFAPIEDWCKPFNKWDEQAARGLSSLAKISCKAQKIYTSLKRPQGLLDFDDLLAYTDRLLTNPGIAADSLRRQIRQLLVDEAQDTNPFQISLLRRLIGPGENGAIPEGKLFIVGDAKQSIYRFQGAQVEVFDKLCHDLGEDRQENLDLSFRTHQAGVEFVNYLFEPLLGDYYEPMQAFRTQTPSHSSVEVLLAKPGKDFDIDTASNALVAQAALVAQRIEQMVKDNEKLVWDRQSQSWREVKYSDIAILLARMTHSLSFERQLELRDIPYYVVGGSGFFKQQEVYDVLNALGAIDNPYNDIALFGALRGSMFSLDDNALTHIAQTCKPPYFPELLERNPLEDIAPKSAVSLDFAIRLIYSLHRRKDAMEIDELVEELLEQTGYEAVLLGQFHGKRLLGNVRRLVDLARGAPQGRLSLTHFIAQMNAQVIDESRYEQAPTVGEAENVVRIMTIHKSKGLEFPVVFMSDLNTRPQSRKEALLYRTDWGLAFNFTQNQQMSDDENDEDEDEGPISHCLACSLEAIDDHRENMRLMYVAATRHEDHLVIVGADWRSKNGRFQSSQSWLDELDNRLNLRGELVDKDEAYIPYGLKPYSIRLRRITPEIVRSHSSDNKGARLLASVQSPEQLEQELIELARKAKGDECPLLAPLPHNLTLSMSVTALGDYRMCPKFYYLRHVLGISPTPSGQKGKPGDRSLNAAQMGTMFHRCMELIDFDKPQPAHELVCLALDELDLAGQADAESLTREFEKMIELLSKSPLWKEIATSDNRIAEADFVLPQGRLEVNGKIDLLYRDGQKQWHIVDYKSDRVNADSIPARAKQYHLQLGLYCCAAQRYLDKYHTGERLVDAGVYFLRPGLSHTIQATAELIQQMEATLDESAESLIHARIQNVYSPLASAPCETCSFNTYCQARQSTHASAL